MRLVCPNCAAQYEIDRSLFPAEGTEVQCSACGTVWFEPGSATGAAPTPPARQTPRSEPAARPKPPEARAPRTEAARSDKAAARPDPATTEPDPVGSPPPAPPRPAASSRPAPGPAEEPAPRALDPAVADVLRQEADFEASQRAREQSNLETQEELGLFGPVDSGLAPVSARSGASSLPDIDDISSTLEPIETGRAGQTELPQTDAARKRSFLAGMGVPLILLVLLTGLYLGAPALARMVPALEAPLGAYVGLVDKARLAVAGLLGVGP